MRISSGHSKIIMGLLILLLSACGSTSDIDATVIAGDKATMAAMATSIAAEQAEEPAATDTLAPTNTPPPTNTPAPTATFTATATPPAQESAGDSLTLAAPTATQAPPSPTPPAEPRLAYSSAGDIIISRPDGSEPVNLTSDVGWALDPYWSPDGSRLVFAAAAEDDPYGEIYVINADGSGLVRLTHDQSIDWDPVWSPDGSRIAFETTRSTVGNPAACNADCNWDVYVMNADGSEVRQLADSDENENSPAWSPAGDRIAFDATIDHQNADIFVMNAEGGSRQNLTNHPAIDIFPAWSADGTRIAFVSNRDGNFDIFVMNADGSEVVNLTNDAAHDQYPAWSADGQRIAFVSTRDNNMLKLHHKHQAITGSGRP